MIYFKNILTTAGGSKSELTVTPLVVTKGLIYSVVVYFPPGSSGLMGVKILHGAHQIYPSNEDEYFIGDNFCYQFDDALLIDAEPFELTIYTYNEDEEYDHSIIIAIGLVSEALYQHRFLPLGQLIGLGDTLNDLTAVIDKMKSMTPEWVNEAENETTIL